MAPKSKRTPRMKKQSLALEVSTPEVTKGQKRKALDESDKGKGKKKKKGESSSTPDQECDHSTFLRIEIKKVNLDDETMRVPRAMSDEYNEKMLKRMGYELKGNQWTPKPSKKIGEGSSSKGKEPMESERPEGEGFEVEMCAFMVQMSDSMKLLYTKVDNMTFHLVIVEKKMRNLTNEVQKRKIPMEESESEEEQEEENENDEEEPEHKGGEDSDQEKEKSDKDDSSEIESDASPALIRRKSQRLSHLSKFKNTSTMALELLPSLTPSPTTPIHDSSPPPSIFLVTF
ncbi:hypothetical protein Acr_12g0001850 [Actinidia rufa]|uniref:Uncharacterized protein n=1 Tax=Actinidia rufa TaxID=165716 RepID=A0A7J0FG13_9ERIC|nr:hypothetical protein Acr_12g0001850 [Actinidia rufa]